MHSTAYSRSESDTTESVERGRNSLILVEDGRGEESVKLFVAGGPSEESEDDEVEASVIVSEEGEEEVEAAESSGERSIIDVSKRASLRC